MKLNFLKQVWGTVVDNVSDFYRQYPRIRALIQQGEPSYSGKYLDEVLAFNSSVVYACCRAIGDPLGMMPFQVFQVSGPEEERKVARKHPAYRLLHDAPNPFTTAVNFRQTLQIHALTWGNGYAQIKRRSGTGELLSLHIIPPNRITPKREPATGEVFYELNGMRPETGMPARLPWSEVLHIPGLSFDGLRGESVISLAKNSIGSDFAAQEYGAKFFARGGRPPYYLRKPQKFKDDAAYNDFVNKWRDQYERSDGYTAPVIEGDVEYHGLGFQPKDMQFLETRKFGIPEICRWFMVYPHMVGEMSEAKFNNVEQLGIEFVQRCIGYWIKVWEQQVWMRLFTEEEQAAGYFAEFNVNSLMRGDFEGRMKGYAVGIQNGFLNADIVCRRENLPMLPNKAGAAYHIQLNMQTVPGTGEPTAIEKATLARAGVTANAKAN